ncbi:MAG: DUF1569 domain-containing protein [Phycisphaerales bacterium]|nr:DUF1569 domain-containing protein [Phycisphaerales bacterium]
MIDTAKSPGHRTLRFRSLDEALIEAERLAVADAVGTLVRTGNWTLGQIFSHVASFMNYPYDGYPPELPTPPWLVRVLLKMMKGKFLGGKLPRGYKIPKLPGGTAGVLDLPTDRALAMLRAAIARLEAAPPSVPNPVFGPLSHEEWKALHLRHMELHFGYVCGRSDEVTE